MTTGIPPRGVEITIFSKIGGPLSKCISLQGDAIVSDGTPCIMTEGAAERALLSGVGDLATTIERLESHQALALGVLRPGLPETVAIKTKARINGAVVADTIARTKSNIIYLPGTAAFALVDFDRKVRTAVEESATVAAG